MQHLPPVDQPYRRGGRGDRDGVPQHVEIDHPEQQQRGDRIDRRDRPPAGQQRPRKAQEEMKSKGREEDARHLLDHEQDLVRQVQLSRWRVDIHHEREQRDQVEERALPARPPEEREQPDRQIEKADEGQKQVLVLDLQRRGRVAQCQRLPIPPHHQRNRTAVTQGLLQPIQLVTRHSAHDPDLISHPEAGPFGTAPGIDSIHVDHALLPDPVKIEPFERRALALKGIERPGNEDHGQETDQDVPDMVAASHRAESRPSNAPASHPSGLSR
jgi:hypothetical protein